MKKRLWGLVLSEVVAPGTVLTLGEEKVGEVRSAVALPEGQALGLGYVRTKVGGQGLTLSAGEVTATVQTVPGLSHDYYEGSLPN